MTAANQKNEANMVKQNVYFVGRFYSEIMCFFFFAVQVPFLYMKYDGGRLQDVIFCFKTYFHENIEN